MKNRVLIQFRLAVAFSSALSAFGAPPTVRAAGRVGAPMLSVIFVDEAAFLAFVHSIALLACLHVRTFRHDPVRTARRIE